MTEGDIILVRQGQQSFQVVVRSLTPESQVNILNTDLEVDLLPSEEVSKQMEQRELAKRLEMEKIQAQERQNTEMLQRQMEKAAQLPPEPPTGSPDTVKCVVKCPDGKQLARLVLKTDPLQLLFDFVQAKCGFPDDSFRLACMYPRRVFTTDQIDRRLETLDIHGRQERFFVELIDETPETPAPVIETKEETKHEATEWDIAREKLMLEIDKV